MEIGGQSCENLGNIIKNYIQQGQTGYKISQSKNPLISLEFFPGGLMPFSKAGGAQHHILMLGDALPAKKTAALRAAGDCLAQHVV